MKNITPFLWFENKAEEAAKFYVSVFPKSKITKVVPYDDASAHVSGMKKGSIMVVDFVLNGNQFTALNGGKVPGFERTSATSFVIPCKDQKEVDHYWNAFAKGGKPQPCGWIVDKYGITWQVTPVMLLKMLGTKKPGALRATKAMLTMSKLDIAKLKEAYDGK